LKPPEIAELLTSQLSLPGYLAPPEPIQRAPDRAYTANEDLWRDVLRSGVRAASVLKLDGFLLSEWLPFTAGVFHTDEGRAEREHAQRAILYDGMQPGAQPTQALRTAVPGVDPRTLGSGKIYSSVGKGGMIAGGVGSVRLKPRRIDVGEVWFMSASSTPIAHEGFPIAVPTEIYTRHADELSEKGAVRCSLTGELRFVENEMRARFGSRVPQLYLLVSQLRRDRVAAPAPLRVSIPVSFQGHDGSVHAAYANFRPGEPGSLERATRWLEETYVTGIYKGRIVTDFDEQIRWFDDADFSLEKVMTGSLDPQQAGTFAERLHLGRHMTTVIIERVELNGTLAAERIDTVHQDRVIQIGDGTTINAPVVIAEQIQGSFNTIQESAADAELKRVLEVLTRAVAKAAPAAPGEQAETMGRDMETLAVEATRANPRRKWYELSLESLRETAQTLGEVGMPILTLTAKIAELLP